MDELGRFRSSAGSSLDKEPFSCLTCRYMQIQTSNSWTTDREDDEGAGAETFGKY